MIKPDTDVIKAFAHVSTNVPRVAKFFEEQYRTELERLPITASKSQPVASGRCQVLKEIVDLLSNAPKHEAPRHG